MSQKLFDPKCYELAVYFLPDADSDERNELAAAIQEAVEDFGLPGICVREDGHDGPCNGLPRTDCAWHALGTVAEKAKAQYDEKSEQYPEHLRSLIQRLSAPREGKPAPETEREHCDGCPKCEGKR